VSVSRKSMGIYYDKQAELYEPHDQAEHSKYLPISMLEFNLGLGIIDVEQK